MTSDLPELTCAAVLFDLDGVLVDSGTAIERSWRRFAVRHGLPEAEVLAACHGRPSTETIAAVAGHLDATAEAAKLEREQAKDTAGLTRCPGAARLLTALPPRGWAVVTSGGRGIATARLTGVRLPIPEVLVTADDVARGKPAPDGYLLAARRLGIPAHRCVAVEDSRPGAQAAKAAGCRVIGIAGDLLGEDSTADVVVSSLAELTAVTGDAGGPAITLTPRRASHV